MQTHFDTRQPAMYFLLAALAVVVLPHMSHLPVWVILSCYSFILWRFLYTLGRVPLPHKLLVYIILFLVLFGLIGSFPTIIGRRSATAMMLVLLCLKLFELRGLRDVAFIIQLALFAVVATFLYSQTIPVTISMLIAVTLLVTALISFSHAKVSYTATPAIEKAHSKLAVKMLAYAMPLAIAAFILFPRSSAPIWGVPEDSFHAQTGISDEMSPGRINRLSDSNEVAFRVEFQSPIPSRPLRYWRGPVLWHFDGFNWTAPTAERKTIKAVPYKSSPDAVSYTITLEPHNSYWLFPLDIPNEIPAFSNLTPELTLLSKKPVNKIIRYTLTSNTRYAPPKIDRLPDARYLNVPDDAAPQARIMLRDITQQAKQPMDVVQAVLELFRTGDFYYSRTPPLLEDYPIDEFLFKTRRGYCEHYASTFTVLMRLAGIPARVVTGYQGGDINPLDNYMIVRQSDAHAWSEVYIEGSGWLRIDPTAVIPADHIESSIDASRILTSAGESYSLPRAKWLGRTLKQLRYSIDMINNRWNQWVIGYNSKKQKSLFSNLGLPEITLESISIILFTVLSIITAIIALNIFIAQRSRISGIDLVYRRFLNKLGRHKLIKSPSEGALDFSMRVAEQFPEQKLNLLRIAAVYNRLRYRDNTTKDLQHLKKVIRELQI